MMEQKEKVPLANTRGESGPRLFITFVGESMSFSSKFYACVFRFMNHEWLTRRRPACVYCFDVLI